MTPPARSLHVRGPLPLGPSLGTTPRRGSEVPAELRSARPGDGPLIARLYRDVYTPPRGGDAGDHYPFPQFMNGLWVDNHLAAGSVIWIVAETGGEIVGAVGVDANIGLAEDRIAEYFGLVVSADRRNQGIATRLLQAMFDRVAPSAAVMLAETRTAEPWGWRALRTLGFLPLGFEPYAHLTPAGFESMILLASTSRAALRARRTNGSCTPAVRRLASAVLTQSDGEPLACLRPAHGPADGQALGRAELAVEVSDLQQTTRCFNRGCAPASAGDTPPDTHRLNDGVVELHHLCGVDSRDGRYTRRRLALAAMLGSSAEASFVFDHRDRRARIERLLVGSPVLYPSVIAATLDAIERVSGGEPFTAVVDVRADAAPLQFCLERAAFFPTAYFPAAVAREGGRRDVVQYSYLCDLALANALSISEPIDWPAARAVIAAVCGRCAAL